MYRRLTIIVFLLFTANFVFSQSFVNPNQRKKIIIRAGTGTSHYFGDLVDNWYFTVNGDFTVGVRYPVWNRVSAAADVTWFMLHGNDANSKDKAPRNLSFFSNNLEISGTVQVDLFEEPVRFYRRAMFNPYLFGGVGYLMFGPKTRYNGEVYALRPLETEGVSYKPYTISFPFGVGVRYKLNAFMNITVEGGLRYTLTDYLDDVSSGIFQDPNSFTDPIARDLADRSANQYMSTQGVEVRGNPKNKDAYGLLLVRVEYYLSPLRDSFRSMFYKGTRVKRRRR